MKTKQERSWFEKNYYKLEQRCGELERRCAELENEKTELANDCERRIKDVRTSLYVHVNKSEKDAEKCAEMSQQIAVLKADVDAFHEQSKRLAEKLAGAEKEAADWRAVAVALAAKNS